MNLSGRDLDFLEQLVALRHDLHRAPELSGDESGTAALLAEHLEALGPDQLVTRLGGHGLAAVFQGEQPGPTVLLRADLDALPITETNTFDHRSGSPGISHQCGHDGHMAMLTGVAHALSGRRPSRGRVILLYQPAEEDGSGARAVIEDPGFLTLAPDVCFALHNIPGEERGRVLARPGGMTCGSRGLRITLEGRESHAAHPETGLSPAAALARLVEGLPMLGEGHPGLALVTVVHARLGRPDFGTAPGDAEVRVTLRADNDDILENLGSQVERMTAEVSAACSLDHGFVWSDPFRTGVNDPVSLGILEQAAGRCGAPFTRMARPFRWSEDFAEFTARWPGALFGLGAGKSCAGLHHPDYDFPDELIPDGVRLWLSLLDVVLDNEPGRETTP